MIPSKKDIGVLVRCDLETTGVPLNNFFTPEVNVAAYLLASGALRYCGVSSNHRFVFEDKPAGKATRLVAELKLGAGIRVDPWLLLFSRQQLSKVHRRAVKKTHKDSRQSASSGS